MTKLTTTHVLTNVRDAIATALIMATILALAVGFDRLVYCNLTACY